MHDWWWLVAPPVLTFLFHDFWLLYVRWKMFYGLDWLLLEIKLPQIVERTPQAMEQVFLGLHGMYSKPKVTQKYFRGEVPNWFSVELASINGETHFYIRVLSKFRNLVESHVWAQYPDAEIREADDYTVTVPRGLPNASWDVWGTEFVLQKQDVYPIRTYIDFENPVEERRLDPLAAVLEVMSSLGPGEQLWFQIVAEPIIDNWRAQGEEVINRLISKKSAKRQNVFEAFLDGSLTFVGGALTDVLEAIFPGLATPPETQKKYEPQAPPSMMMHLSQPEKDIVEAIGKNIAKMAFLVGVRVVYVARRDVFNKAMPSAVFGSIRQFNTLNLNGFKPNMRTLPNAYYIMPKFRNEFRKRRLDWRYRLRFFHGRFAKRYVLNVEEMATVYHFPGMLVAKAPMLSRIDAKRAEPPATLPTA